MSFLRGGTSRSAVYTMLDANSKLLLDETSKVVPNRMSQGLPRVVPRRSLMPLTLSHMFPERNSRPDPHHAAIPHETRPRKDVVSTVGNPHTSRGTARSCNPTPGDNLAEYRPYQVNQRGATHLEGHGHLHSTSFGQSSLTWSKPN
jgi:hypothetical protein